MKVVITHWVHPEIWACLSKFAEVYGPTEPAVVWPRQRVLEEAADADAVITSMADYVDEAFLAACPRLQIVSATLKGYDNYDAEACTRHGVWLSIVPDSIIAPTAELAITLTLSLMRNVRDGDISVRSGKYAGWLPQLYGGTLTGATVGMVGMGQLGTAIARLLRSFDVQQMLYFDESEKASLESEPTNWQKVNIDTLLHESDVVIVSLPLTSSTHHLIDTKMLTAARPGSYLINIGRGSVMNELAVLEALESGKLAGYASDVFEMEDWALPSRPSSIPTALLQHPRTVFTPHLGSAVDSVRKQMSLTAATQVRQALHGGKPTHSVNIPAKRSKLVNEN